jgi:hypothetical protein
VRRALAALALFCAACAPTPRTDHGWAPLEITLHPMAPTAAGVGAQYGALTFRGGYWIVGEDRDFGGWSSIKIGPDGRLVAISDAGLWFSARILTDPKTGDFDGVDDMRMAFMRGEDGKPLPSKEEADAEGMAVLPDGRFAVSFEQRHRIELFDLMTQGPTAASRPGPPVPAEGLRPNEGVEALAATADGDLIAGSEYAPPGKSHSVFYRLTPGAPAAKAVRAVGFAETTLGNALVDMDRLPNGDYVALERFYFPGIGNKTVIRRYAASGLAADPPVLAGPVLAHFASPQKIDNFEGIAAQARPDGGARLYIISDDNYSRSQKTLLYAFDLPAPVNAPSASAPPR